MKQDVIYIIETDVGSYTLYGSGYTPRQAIDSIWKEYRSHWVEYGGWNPTKKQWLEWHGIDENSCKEIAIGQSWSR